MDRSLQSNPVNLQFVENYAAVLQRAGEHDALIRLCQHGLQFAPTSAVLLHASAAALLAQGRHSEAIDAADDGLWRTTRAISRRISCWAPPLRRPGNTKRRSHHMTGHCGSTRSSPRRISTRAPSTSLTVVISDALAAYDQALAVRPDFAEAWLGRCYTLIQLGRHEDALAAVDKALALRPDFAEAWVGRGNALLDLQSPAGGCGRLRPRARGAARPRGRLVGTRQCSASIGTASGSGSRLRPRPRRGFHVRRGVARSRHAGAFARPS